MRRLLLAATFGLLATTVALTRGVTQQTAAVIENTAAGNLIVHPINHATLRFEFKGKQYYCDPSGRAEWPTLPKADYIFITHEHGDHLNPMIVDIIKSSTVAVYMNASAQSKSSSTVPNAQIIAHGEKKAVGDATVEAIPAYNLTPERLMFHPKDRNDNGYLLTFGGKRVYVAGDTEDIPEMRALKNIDLAFLPCNLPYTMDAKQCAAGARAFKPKVLYPYHQGKTNPNEVKDALADVKEIEVRVLALP